MSEARSELLAAIEGAVTATLDRQLPDLVDELAEQVVEQVADRVAVKLAERIGEPTPREPTLIDVAEVARRFGVSRDYVYEHSEELGAMRIGNGRNPRLRFDPRKVEQAFAGRREEPKVEKAQRRPRRRRSGRAELLPIGSDPT
jgi:hypothetical protein